MVWCVRFAKLGVHRDCDLEWELVRRCEAVPENYASDESALYSLSVFNGDVTSVNEGLLFSVTLDFTSRATAK